MWQVDIAPIVDWLRALDDDSREQVVAAVELVPAEHPLADDLFDEHLRTLEGE